MSPFPHVPDSGDDDANAALSRLLEHLDAAIRDTTDDSVGLPLFGVEARLADRLRTALPGVRFTPEEIRSWGPELQLTPVSVMGC